MSRPIYAFLLLCSLLSCRHDPVIPPGPIEPPGPALPAGASFLHPAAQRSGDPVAGYAYLTGGNYVSSGIPINVFKQVYGSSNPNDLDRTGDADGIAYNFNVTTASNGVKIVTPSCLTCHAEFLNGQLMIGLGDNTHDYTVDQGAQFQTADLAIKLLYGQNSPQWDAYYPASRAYQAISPYIYTKVRGQNPADKIFATLSAFRQSGDLSWLDYSQYTVPVDAVPTDVPAWWHMKKKNTLYYNGLGRGDHARLMMVSGLLTMKDSTEARQIDQHFADVAAYIRTLEAPAYPYSIDQTLVAQGKAIFEHNCSQCHGTYSSVASEETYPNLIVDLAHIGTDPALSEAYQTHPEHHTWFNGSWFSKAPYAAQLLPNDGYVAPPLDGIWATAPYLHNGSVPTLEDLLYSPQRPVYWRRTFDNSDYNTEKVGWNYTAEAGKTDVNTYDTTLPFYTNTGHVFGDVLTLEERHSLLEYLKTL